MKKIPMRMDALTRKRFMQSELSRFVERNGFLVFDSLGKMQGRGVYLRLDEEISLLLSHPKFASRLPHPLLEGELEKAKGGSIHEGN